MRSKRRCLVLELSVEAAGFMALFPSLLWPDPGPRVSTRGPSKLAC